MAKQKKPAAAPQGMQAMPPMLAYTIQSWLYQGGRPSATIGYGQNGTHMTPAAPQDDSYWIAIINAKNPREKVKEWVVPGANNSTVPSGLDTYMADSDYLFLVATQYLSTLHIPQGAFYDFLVEYGAGRELQKLEQLATVLSCGTYSRISYILTGQCGKRVPGQPAPTSYEMGSYGNAPLMMMSLMPLPNGSPPYGICDSYTFYHKTAASAGKAAATS
jgi:hypothetical protein